jgi:hypothetical protein
MYSGLNQALTTFQDRGLSWESLIQEAEKQGISPLLYRHIRAIDFAVPDKARRMLQGLFLRSRQSNIIRNRAAAEILNCFSLEGIDTLTVKGIALCNFAYSEAGLRPMRDIDLLVREADLERSEKILSDLGYLPDADHNIPDDYYHRVPMSRTIDGLPLSIELHHNLLPFHPQYPLWPLEKSYDTAMEFKINGITARTLCLEDTLWYVYLHGFQAPLTYESFRFIHVADMVSLVEKYLDTVNWQAVRKNVPTLLNVLSRFHYLTPWQDSVAAQLELDIGKRPGGTGLPFRGWPKRRLTAARKTGLLQLTKDTLWPSQWWMQVYYGHVRGGGYWKARLVEHPRQVWRWAKAYRHLRLQNVTDKTR